MCQDSFSAGFEYQLKPPRVLAVNYVHNNLIRTIEDVGRLIDGSEVYMYGNPGEGIVEDALLQPHHARSMSESRSGNTTRCSSR